MRVLTVLSLVTTLSSASELFSRGYTLVPEPQQVKLEPGDFRFGNGWSVELGDAVKLDSVAVESLREDLHSRFGVDLKSDGGSGVIRLEIAPGAVHPGPSQDRDSTAIASQAYRLQLTPSRILISGNDDAGLFYAVETLVQLVTPRKDGLWLPAGEILDWPDLRFRQMYRDDAHHLDHPDELKRAIRQAAFFKMNGFAIKLEGHFQFRSALAVVEPQALSPNAT